MLIEHKIRGPVDSFLQKQYNKNTGIIDKNQNGATIMTNDTISAKIKYLFDRYWDEELTEEQEDALQATADELVVSYGWETVFAAVENYLHEYCLTPESVINFANNYWGYYWDDKPIANPHRFLGYLYYRVNFEAAKYDGADILDSLATTLLPKAGYKEADLWFNPRYMPETDPKIIEAANAFAKEWQSTK